MKPLFIDQSFECESGVTRTPGLHLTEVMESIGRKMNFLDWPPRVPGEELPHARFELGFIWERLAELTNVSSEGYSAFYQHLWELLLGRVFADRETFRPDEMECDGILLSPDGFGYDQSGNPCLVEYKCTWKYDPGKGEPMTTDQIFTYLSHTKQWWWLTQMKSYCHACGFSRAILRVLYINGHGNKQPMYRAYCVQFTKKELSDNWNMMLRHAETLEKETE